MQNQTPTGTDMSRFTKIAAVALSIALLIGATSSKAAMRPLTQPATARYIVRVSGDDTVSQERTLRSIGGDVYRHLTLIHSLAVELPVRNVDRLKSLKFVQHISPDGMVRKCDEFTVASSGAGVAYTNDGLTGLGVNVAVVDSGVRLEDDLHDGLANPAHPTLAASRIVTSISFVPATSTAPYSTVDACGHGTHVAGSIIGCGIDSTGPTFTNTYYGIARRAGVVNVRVLDQSGEGSVSQVISGIQWVVTNKATYHIGVMNLSLGEPVGESYTVDPLCLAAEAAWKAGIVVVVAAGNDGRLNTTQVTGESNEGWGTSYGSITSPGNDPYVITVGATKNYDGVRADDRIATYSSRGPSRLDMILKPDIIAPGNKIISLAMSQGTLAGVNVLPWSAYSTAPTSPTAGKYFTLSGTSMAAPVVAGAAALLLQASPGLSPDTIKARLMVSADKWADPTGVADPCTYGAGYLDIPAALTQTIVATQSAMSPSVSEDTSGDVSINVNSTLWGSRAVWGTGVDDLRAVWGTNAVASATDGTLTDSRAVWGTTVWTNRAVWGTTTTAVDLSSIVLNGE